MSLARRIEDLEDSAVLGRKTSARLMELYVEEAIPLAANVHVVIERDKRAFTTRVAFHGPGSSYKYIAVQHDFYDTALEYRASIDQMLYKIQEELEEEPQDAEDAYGPYEVQGQHISTKPKPGAYAPKAWAKKLAEQAMK